MKTSQLKIGGEHNSPSDGRTTSRQTAAGAVSVQSDASNVEHFIPLQKAELIDRLCQQPGLSSADQDAFRRLIRTPTPWHWPI
jgi:hypothetical protein